MVATKDGNKKVARKNSKKKEFYQKIGRAGGQAFNIDPGGFGSSMVGADGLTGRERAKIAGRAGGKKSKRGAAKHKRGYLW